MNNLGFGPGNILAGHRANQMRLMQMGRAPSPIGATAPRQGPNMGTQLGQGLGAIGKMLGQFGAQKKAEEQDAAAQKSVMGLLNEGRNQAMEAHGGPTVQAASQAEAAKPMFPPQVKRLARAWAESGKAKEAMDLLQSYALKERPESKPSREWVVGPDGKPALMDASVIAESPGVYRPYEKPGANAGPKTIKGADGHQYYVDGANAGKRVLPGVKTKPNLTNDWKNYQLALSQNPNIGTFTEYQRSLRAASAPRNEGTIPTGMQAVRDDQGRLVRYEPVPGSKQAQEAKAQIAAAEMKTAQKTTQSTVVTEDIDRVLASVAEDPTIVAGLFAPALSLIAGSPAHDVSKNLGTIKASIGFDKLQAMRESSPTGGALGSVSERENELLQSVFGALAQSQSPGQLAYNLRRLHNVYSDTVHGPNAGPSKESFRYDVKTGERVPVANYPGGSIDVNTVDLDTFTPDMVDDLTDEEAAILMKRLDERDAGLGGAEVPSR